MKKKLPKTSRLPVVRTWYDGVDLELGADELIADNFAGGGGASTGIELGLGRSPDLAVNHDPEAIAMHAANHPDTEHHIESVWKIDPRVACRGCPVALAWFSPDCKHHSKSRGGKPREQKIRGLAWVAVTWAQRVAPRVIALENVEEFRDWGPLHRTHSSGCRGEHLHPCPSKHAKCHYEKPIKARAGETFDAFVGKLESLGYVVEHQLLRASDFGAPTSRRRLFLIARRDGKTIVWPEPTHGPGRASPHRTAAEVIDWSIECPSVFAPGRDLVEKTLARLARGVWEFVVKASKPFVLPVNHGGVGRDDRRVHDVEEPLRTITSHGRGSHAVAVPYLIHRSNGERPGQAPRIYDVQKPLHTIVADGQKEAACAAFLAKHYGDRPTGGWAGGQAIDKSIGTVTTKDHHALVAANLIKYHGTSSASPIDAPLGAVLAGGEHHALETAYLARYNGQGDAARLELGAPVGTLTTRDRYALVSERLAPEWPPLEGAALERAREIAALLRRFGYPVGDLVWVEVDGERYVVADLGMRMLTPRELFRAQGFPEHYQIAPESPIVPGKLLSRTAQVRMCGNSVCPPLAAAIVRAQFARRNIQSTIGVAAA